MSSPSRIVGARNAEWRSLFTARRAWSILPHGDHVPVFLVGELGQVQEINAAATSVDRTGAPVACAQSLERRDRCPRSLIIEAAGRSGCHFHPPAACGFAGDSNTDSPHRPNMSGHFRRVGIAALLLIREPLAAATPNIAPQAEELLFLDNGAVKIGVDRTKGGAITWLSWSAYPKNAVNIADPGRLIQQSYYAGLRIDRRAEGQSPAWSPWAWNPIQGGGVSSWARVTAFERQADATLYTETVPKLWDMPDEEAAARMRQWSGFEAGMPDVVVVRCEFTADRTAPDRWGPARLSPQEIPACYFTRNFQVIKSYLGAGEWRTETQPPGPPWGKTRPPRNAMAVFTTSGEGVAVFSPAATQPWNFGPHGGRMSDDPKAGPCVHVAPVDRVQLGPKSKYRYRYWLIVGGETQIAARLDLLIRNHGDERAELTNP